MGIVNSHSHFCVIKMSYYYCMSSQLIDQFPNTGKMALHCARKVFVWPVFFIVNIAPLQE